MLLPPVPFPAVKSPPVKAGKSDNREADPQQCIFFVFEISQLNRLRNPISQNFLKVTRSTNLESNKLRNRPRMIAKSDISSFFIRIFPKHTAKRAEKSEINRSTANMNGLIRRIPDHMLQCLPIQTARLYETTSAADAVEY